MEPEARPVVFTPANEPYLGRPLLSPRSANHFRNGAKRCHGADVARPRPY